MLLLSVKKTITDDNTLNKERCRISSSLEHSSLPVLQAGLSPEAPFATWPAQSDLRGVNKSFWPWIPQAR